MIVLGLLLIGAGGCWDRIDINQLAVVLVLSIDRSPSGDISLGAQIVIPGDASFGGSMGGGGGTGARAVYTVTGVGRTLSAALGNVQSKVPRRLFLGNAQVLALGEDYARNGISTILDVVARTLQLRESMDVVVTQGPALRLLQARPRLESFPGSELAALLTQNIVPRVDILQLIKILHDHTGDAAVPWLEIKTLNDTLGGSQTAQGGQGGTTQETELPAQKEIYRMAGLALFRGDRLTKFMPLLDARGLAWTKGAFSGATISVDWPPPEDVKPAAAPAAGEKPPGAGASGTPQGPGGGQPARNVIVFRIIHILGTWRVQVHGDRVDATLQLTAEDEVQEDPGGVDVTDLRLLPAIDQALGDRISDRVRSAFQFAQQADSDIFRIGLQVAMQDPKAWSRLHERWSSEIYPHVSLHVRTEPNIRRLGSVESPLPQQSRQLQK